jgi:hypothetical protein
MIMMTMKAGDSISGGQGYDVTPIIDRQYFNAIVSGNKAGSYLK